MKIGIHLSVFTENWNDDVLPFVSLVKEIGYDSVEIPLMDPYNIDVAKVKEVLSRNELLVTCGTGLGEQTDITSLNEEIRRNGINHVKKCIDICAELGSKTLNGVVHSPWGLLVPREEYKNQRVKGIESLNELAKYCEEKNVSLCLEMLNRYESSYLNTFEDGITVINEVGSDFIKLHCDTFHSNIEEKDLYGMVDKYVTHIGHVHFADNHRGTPGTGQIQFDRIVQSLKNGNYDNHIVVEVFVKPNCQAGNDVNVWREIETDSITMAKDSYKYIRSLIEEN